MLAAPFILLRGQDARTRHRPGSRRLLTA